MEQISCPICYNVFQSESVGGVIDRKPQIACGNGHTICAECFAQLSDRQSPCPTCRADLLRTPIVNRALLETVDNYAKALDRVPEIPVEEITIAATSFACGAFAEVFDAKWFKQDVAVKVLRSMKEIDRQIKQFRLEVNLVVGLHHPNIIRVFGTTRVGGGMFGIVMEKADRGSLYMYVQRLETEMAAKIGLGVIDGLEYVHSRKVAHRDLKPDNILLFGPQLIPKIADFGISKVIRTIITNSAMVGTPKYAAPELLQPGSKYGYSVDIFSLSVILFEMFSGQPAEQGLGSNVMQIMFAVVQGKRPKIPDKFPSCLRSPVERGWDADPSKRTSLAEFRASLQTLVTEPRASTPKIETKNLSKLQQATEVATINLPLPILSINWNSSCDVLNSRDLRLEMVEAIKTKSNMRSIVNDSVLSVMKVVPRHLFIETQRLDRAAQSSQQEVIKAAYLYHQPMPATMHSQESSPEIIGTQLSMTEIIQGQSVLLVGMKGGYIQSLVAQLVGINGSVVTATAHQNALSVCRDRVNLYCPLKNIVNWVKVPDAKDCGGIVGELQRQKMKFHTVIYCGVVDNFPSELISVLHSAGNVSIMAPVREGADVRFQLYLRRGGKVEMRTITDFGVIFEDVH